MKRIFTLIAALLFTFSYVSLAVPQKEKKVENFNNPTCPIMNRKVNGKNFAVYKNVRYELCCGGCEKTFPKNPEKYLSKLPNNGKILELNNTTCPVMGGKVNKKIYAVHNGTKVYFCCPGCISTFKKDPEKYLKKIPEQQSQ